MARVEYSDEEGSFGIDVVDGWESEPDEDGGLLVAPASGDALLHLIPFSREPDEDLDPAEELYAFLAEQEIELEEDEVEDVELDGESGLALCEYLSEEAEDGEEFLLIGVATAPGRLVFASFSCAPEQGDQYAPEVRSMLATLLL